MQSLHHAQEEKVDSDNESHSDCEMQSNEEDHKDAFESFEQVFDYAFLCVKNNEDEELGKRIISLNNVPNPNEAYMALLEIFIELFCDSEKFEMDHEELIILIGNALFHIDSSNKAPNLILQEVLAKRGSPSELLVAHNLRNEWKNFLNQDKFEDQIMKHIPRFNEYFRTLNTKKRFLGKILRVIILLRLLKDTKQHAIAKSVCSILVSPFFKSDAESKRYVYEILKLKQEH